MEIGHGQSNEIEQAIHDQIQQLETGHGQEINQSWTEGIRYNAACDGKNHYLYKIDKAAVNPKTGHGYSKGRIYAGTFDKIRSRCEAYAANWQSEHSCGAGRSGDGHGRSAGHGNSRSQSVEGSSP